MKITLDSALFTFTPASNLVDFDNMAGTFKPERLLAVINTTTGKVIYSAASEPSGYNGSFSNGVFTNSQLTYVSSNVGQSPSDILQCLYDTENGVPEYLVNPNTGNYVEIGTGAPSPDTLQVVSYPYALAGVPQDYGSGATGPATQRVVVVTDQTKIPSQISDGINNVAIKPALIAPVASDPSLVVAMSPNSALPLPTGAATSALQTTGNITLSTISGKLPAALGTQTIANSMAVNIASDQIVPTSLPDLNITGAAAQTAVINNILPAIASANATDVAGYRSGSVQVVSTGTGGTFIFEGSNDNVNFQNIPVFVQGIPNPSFINSTIIPTVSQIIYTFPIAFRYMRLRITTTITGGSIQAFSRFSQASWSTATTIVSQPNGSHLNVTIDSGTVVLQSVSTTDIPSAPITTTTTSANIATTNIQSVSFLINVTATSGIGQTLDVVVQETLDGTNYYDVYHFERITAVGQYYSPVMRLSGIGYRYVRTVAGTTPSFTMSAVRIRRSGNAGLMRRLFDRTMNPNTTGSSSAALFIEGTNQPFLVVSTGAGGSGGPPTFGIQGSEDGTNWFLINGSTVTVGTSSIGYANPLQGHLPKFIRATVTSGGGSGYTLNYATIKSMGN